MPTRTYSWWWDALRVVNALVLIGTLVGIYGAINTEWHYEYLQPANSPGQLQDERTLDPAWWMFIFVNIMRVLAYGAMRGRLADPKDTWYRWETMVVFVLWIGIEIAAIIIQFIEYDTCNAAPAIGTYNRCNDPRWCCAYGTVDPAPTPATMIQPGCPLLLEPCDPPRPPDALRPDPMWVLSFAISWVMLVLALIEAIGAFMLRDGRTQGSTDSEELLDTAEGTDYDTNGAYAVNPAMLSGTGPSLRAGDLFVKNKSQ